MIWLLVTIVSYFLLAVVTVGDAYFVQRRLKPITFAFYVGVSGLLVLLLTPFFGLPVPEIYNLVLALTAGVLSSFSLVPFYEGIRIFEVSRMAAATGALLPVFTLLLSLFLLPSEHLNFLGIFAMALLVGGSVAITAEGLRKESQKSIILAALSSILWAAAIVFSKYVYLRTSFWAGFLWLTVGQFAASVIFFVFSRSLRGEFFGHLNLLRSKERGQGVKLTLLYFANKFFGASGSVLQNVAIYLAPALYVAVVPALQGIQYIFILLFTAFISFKFPNLLRETFTEKTFLQKFIAILFIAAGIAMLSFADLPPR